MANEDYNLGIVLAGWVLLILSIYVNAFYIQPIISSYSWVAGFAVFLAIGYLGNFYSLGDGCATFRNMRIGCNHPNLASHMVFAIRRISCAILSALPVGAFIFLALPLKNDMLGNIALAAARVCLVPLIPVILLALLSSLKIGDRIKGHPYSFMALYLILTIIAIYVALALLHPGTSGLNPSELFQYKFAAYAILPISIVLLIAVYRILEFNYSSNAAGLSDLGDILWFFSGLSLVAFLVIAFAFP